MRADPTLFQHGEAEVFVERPVPRHLGVGGEGDRVAAGIAGPCPYLVHECTTRAQPLVVRVHDHLVDVGTSVYLGHHHVADRFAGIAEDNPASLAYRVAVEFLDGRRLVVGDLRQPDITELAPCKPLDLLQATGVKLQRGADTEHPRSMTSGPGGPGPGARSPRRGADDVRRRRRRRGYPSEGRLQNQVREPTDRRGAVGSVRR